MADSGGLSGRAGRKPDTANLISSFYLEMEYLLERVEGASNHYQTLGVDRSASSEEINAAFEQAVVVLQPPNYKVRQALPEELQSRIGSGFAKVSEAFDVLTDSERRSAYDSSTINKRAFIRFQPIETKWAPTRFSTRPLNPDAAQVAETSEPPAVEHDGSRTIDIRIFYEQQRAYVKASKDAAAKLRRCERFKLSIPALITGYERDGKKWKEVSKTTNVSRVGAAVMMARRIRHGMIVQILLPLPTKLRSHGFTEPSYNTYAIVRRVEPPSDGRRLVGFEFIGAHPPQDFVKHPWATFRTQKWAGPDRRREPREIIVERVEVEYLDAGCNVLAHETAVTENISASGTRIRVKSPPSEFDGLRIKCAKHNFQSLAVLRNQYVGKDDIERLSLEFIENNFPGLPTAASLAAAQEDSGER
jgi:hypothetical protein